MNLHFLRYCVAYIIPLSVLFSFQQNGFMTFSAFFLAFGIIPFIELFIKPFNKNLNEDTKKRIASNPIFSWILYLSVPMQIFCLYLFFETISNPTLTPLEYSGITIAMGIMCGVFGINIGHELGHRKNRFEQFLAEILLLTSLESHFLPYHNQGHHLKVATLDDPATARRNESVFFFWIRSHFTGYIQAWKIESVRMNKKKSIFANRMIWYTISQLILIICIWQLYGLFVVLLFIAAAIFGILLLETVNYIEHYGLERNLKENGRYERVLPIHSWNSNHILGRTILFELSRHSDHHYLASKHYQLLDSTDHSPQMPTGYPGMMLLSLIPPIWFHIMNKKIDRLKTT